MFESFLKRVEPKDHALQQTGMLTKVRCQGYSRGKIFCEMKMESWLLLIIVYTTTLSFIFLLSHIKSADV